MLLKRWVGNFESKSFLIIIKCTQYIFGVFQKGFGPFQAKMAAIVGFAYVILINKLNSLNRCQCMVKFQMVRSESKKNLMETYQLIPLPYIYGWRCL